MVLKYVYFGFAVLGIFLFFFLLKRFFRWLQKKLDKLDRNVLFGNSKMVNFFKFITPTREKHILKVSVRVLRITISIFFLTLYLPFAFSFFPQTQEVAATVFDYVLKPVTFVIEGFVSFIPGFFFHNSNYFHH